MRHFELLGSKLTGKLFFILLTALTLTTLGLSAHAAPSETEEQTDSLGGFTPTPKITLTFRRTRFAVGSQAVGTVSINGPQGATGRYTVSVSGPGTATMIELQIGGTPGSNVGDVTVNLPAQSGEAIYTASATIAGREVSDSDQLTAVAVESLEYRLVVDGVGQGEYSPVPDPLYVAVGQSVEFKAIPTPTGEWPQGKPVWKRNDDNIGTGATLITGFGDISTSSTDYKTLIAECGNEVRANIIAAKLDITNSGDYIVPGSARNRVEYTAAPTGLTADSGTLKIFKSGDSTNPIRTIVLQDDQLETGSRFVEWDGLDSNGNPLTEADSPYTYKVTLVKTGQEIADVEENRLIKSWYLGVTIGDQPVANEGLVTGVDEETITNDNFEVTVGFDTEPDTQATVSGYDIDADQESSNGPSGNEWDARVWLKKNADNRMIFYTTPTTGNSVITYKVTMESKDYMVRDNVLNRWDMEPATGDLETKGILIFGLNSDGSLRNLVQSYEVVQ